ncbi:MAG: hypothetical protein BWX80_03391 [Candidatus Hydrogenedentes bacterium ADurb.Bin101]|nr:MAG: hypothetical protein BWX80_03391 [Candidatus Hydrogenedentes bacterium ADurb.Bin101]
MNHRRIIALEIQQAQHEIHDVGQHAPVEGLENQGLHVIHATLLADGQVGGEQVAQVLAQPRRGLIEQAVIAPQTRDIHLL